MQDLLSINDLIELKSSIISEEAVAWQKTSKVGERMVALFDKCKEYRKKHFFPGSNNWREIAYDISKIIDKELPPIWEKELGLDIKKIHFNCSEPSGFIAIDYVTNEDIQAVSLLDKIAEGSISKEEISKKYLRRMKDMIEKASGFDRVTGKLKNKTWKIDLYIDITFFFFYDLFCPKSLLNDNTFTAEMTSRECTAILLHEAGHAMYIIEHIAYGYSVQLQFTNLVNGFFKSNPSIEDIRDFCISIINPAIETALNQQNVSTTMKDNTKFVKEAINKIVSFCDILIALKEKVKVKFTPKYEDDEVSKISEQMNTEEYTGDDSIFVYGVTLIARVLIILLKLLDLLYWPLIMYHFRILGFFLFGVIYGNFIPLFEMVSKIFEIIDELTLETHTMNGNKTSDMKGTGHEIYLNERSADEHVVRHGFGGDLASGLIKVRMLFDPVLFINQNNYIRNSKLLLWLANISEVLTKIDKGTETYYTYEWDDKRIRRVCQNCISFFKNAKVSPQYRDNMLISLKRALNCLDRLNKDLYNRDKSEKLIRVIRTLLKPSEWVRIITSGRLTQEYENHLNQIEDLSNSLLFAHSAEFSKILDDMKKKK